jgi:hypothetical protein
MPAAARVPSSRCYLARFFSVILLVASTSVGSATAQDSAQKKAEFERKREETKAQIERKRKELKAELERKRTDRKPPSERIQGGQKTTIVKAPKKPAPNTFDEKTKQFICPAGKFTAFLPANPRAGTATVFGVTLNMYTLQDREGAYAVAYADLPIPVGESTAQTEMRLDAARDGMIKNINGKLTGESRVMLNGTHRGREVRATLTAAGKNGTLRARIYLVGTRLYQVAVVGEPQWTNTGEADKVLASLALIP